MLAPHNNATSLQVTAPVMAGVCYIIDNPNLGIVEPEEIDHERILEMASPYLGPLVGEYSDWSPLVGRNKLFDEDVDTECPWQLRNFLV